MVRKIIKIALAATITLPAASFAATPSNGDLNLDDLYFNASKNPHLTADENTALSKQHNWNKTGRVTPFIGHNGTVQFVYGTQVPSILCAVFQLTDIALEPGEQMNSLHVGDTARWNVDPAVSGNGGAEVQHIIIKPLDVGLDTAMIIQTNKRTYYLKLRSHRTQFMSSVAFTYPEEQQANLAAFMQRQARTKEEHTLPTGEYLGNLDFHYRVMGDAPWRPVRVYNDGNKTIIEMPDSVTHQEAPSLLVMSDYSSSPALVNSRLQGNRFIVDQLFNKAILIAGVGNRQKKVTIIKGDE